ncbi:hypothetical protein ACHAWU_009517 [Discostella pseudostelligera]|uniref:Uncharacterized protein n=1 Tax=Discostella pseudostelligera TaxID=259834 RepID=A0ABD3MCP4_9STRA
MWSSITLPKARTVIATSTLVASSYLYVAYRGHDQRALSSSEVADARDAIVAHIAPSMSTTTMSSSSLSTTPQSHDALASQHLQNLSKYGTTVVKNTLSPKQLVEWNRITKGVFDGGAQNKNNNNSSSSIVWQSGRAHCHISKNSIHCNKMTCVGCNCNESSTEEIRDTWWDNLLERRRRRRSSNGETLPPIHLQDIVQSYFQLHGIQRYMLTDIQFLNAYPQSTNQIWHRDNTSRGLTAIVALCNIRDNGPTEMLLGSHESNFSLWSHWWNTIQNCFIRNGDLDTQKPAPLLLLLGCIDAGDALLYDARIFHRGRGYYNNSIHSDKIYDDGENDVIIDRPVLVLRWDAANTPPPGAGIIVTSMNAYVGSMMYASLFVLRKITAYCN